MPLLKNILIVRKIKPESYAIHNGGKTNVRAGAVTTAWKPSPPKHSLWTILFHLVGEGLHLGQILSPVARSVIVKKKYVTDRVARLFRAIITKKKLIQQKIPDNGK